MDIESIKKKYLNNITARSEKENLEKRVSEAYSTGENISQLSIDLAYYSTLCSYIDQINLCLQRYDEASKIIGEDSDKELVEIARSEIEETENKLTQLDKEVTKLQIDREFVDEDDNRSAIIEIRAGAGGDEAALFAADLFKMYDNYAKKNGWDIQIIDSSVSEGGGYKEVIAQVNGKNAYKKLKYESGVHRVQRIPITESAGRIHTSTASVAILPEAKNIDIEINPEDLRIDVMRASGAGGQCVNRTDSAVRITHIPTGIVVSCQETKHQSQNKEKAMALLRSRLYDRKKKEEQEKRSNLRSSQIGSGMRAEKIRTYNFPQNRITDHRIKKSWHNIEGALHGEIDDMISDTLEGIQLETLRNAEQ